MKLIELTGTPWNRYGHRRIYVSAGDQKIGWFEPVSLEAHPESVEHQSLLDEFAARWEADQGRGPAPSSKSANRTRSAGAQGEVQSAKVENVDLSLVPAGSKAGEKAAELLSKKSEMERLADFWLMRKTDSEAWRRGALGERLVGAQLSRLPDPWKALHSVPVGTQGSDIDHVVIGPGGVFTVNTKNHARVRANVNPSGVWVGGRPTRYVRNALFEAQRAASVLSENVAPIICIIPSVDGHYSHAGDPDGVTVLTEDEILLWLRLQPAILSPDQVANIWERARWSSTWAA